MKRILLVALVIIVLKFLLNLQNYFKIKKFRRYYEEFLEGNRDDMPSYKQEVCFLLKKAQIPDAQIPVVEPIGYRHVLSAKISIQSMFPTTRTDFAAETLNMLAAAEGVFFKNMIDSFNPLYWIELLIFLPKNLLAYIGLNPETTAFRLCNVLLTFIWWVFVAVLTFFKPQLQKFFIELMGNL